MRNMTSSESDYANSLYDIYKRKLPRILIIAKSEYRKMSSDSRQKGMTFTITADEGKLISIAILPNGSSLNTRLHELGHVYDIEKRQSIDNSISDTIHAELEARVYVSDVRGRLFTDYQIEQYADYIRRAHPEYTIKSVIRKIKKALVKYGYYWCVTTQEAISIMGDYD